MNPEQRIAYINGQIACALIELAAMQAANTERLATGHIIAYDEAAFLSLQDKYCLSHNAIISYLR